MWQVIPALVSVTRVKAIEIIGTGFLQVRCPSCHITNAVKAPPGPVTHYQQCSNTEKHTQHKTFLRPFSGIPEWAGARSNLPLVQGKITEADTPTIWMRATLSGAISDPPPNISPFLCRMPFLLQPSHFILAWDRHQICWLAYPVARNWLQ